MKIRCNCCDNKPTYTLYEPAKDEQLFCECGKLLAYSKLWMGKYEWRILNINYDSDSDFMPVEIIEHDFEMM